jgi:tetratricopeptide (TPR) repeat protein
MGAISNSRRHRPLWPALVAALLLAAHAAPAADRDAFRLRAGTTLAAARVRFNRNPTNAAAAGDFGAACFDFAEFATNDTERATLAVEGIAAMRDLVAREPRAAAGHYYLAMNLGQLARTKMLGALRIVDEMEQEFKLANEYDPHWDHAGPARNLGELYFQAPGWPTSIGSRHKAKTCLERAAELAPDYPENRLNLLEAYLKWNDKKGVQRELKAVADLWPEARKDLTGPKWESAWADWEKRRSELAKAATRWLSSSPGRTGP